jgi:hypothetical protein
MAVAKKRSKAKLDVSDIPVPPNEAPAPTGRPRVPTDVPHIYADMASDVVYGIHTTKVILAEEVSDGAGGKHPVAVVVMPTATLLALARGLVMDLTRPEAIEETAQRFGSILGYMKGDSVK